MAQNPTRTIDVDIAIIGGGIAGLWLLNRLAGSGYSTVLFEQTALGSDQTVASQGMIHGGIKYTLGGALSGASEAIADMPELWRACLRGEGDVDLRGVNTLSDHFYLWSSSSALSKMSTFLASKATRGRVQKVKKHDRPAIFQHPDFSGTLYRLVDMVLDVPGTVAKLTDNYRDRIYHIDWHKAGWHSSNGTNALDFTDNGQTIRLNAQQFVLTAGQGNEQLLQALSADMPKTQRRPLQQAVVIHRYPHRFYGHCLGAETTPRLTISSHPVADSDYQAWYLGGSLAEKGASESAEAVIANAKQELNTLMPWVELADAHWSTVSINRAEPRQRNFARPDKAFAQPIDSSHNVIAAWPTKLTLSPNLADEVESLLHEKHIKPTHSQPSLDFLPRPPMASTPWDKAASSIKGEQ